MDEFVLPLLYCYTKRAECDFFSLVVSKNLLPLNDEAFKDMINIYCASWPQLAYKVSAYKVFDPTLRGII